MDLARVFSTAVFGQSWEQLDELLLAFALSSLIGLEREIKPKLGIPLTKVDVGHTFSVYGRLPAYRYGP